MIFYFRKNNREEFIKILKTIIKKTKLLMSQYKTFETERLILKPTLEEDAAFILELLNTPKWIKYVGERNVKTVEDGKNYILEKMKPQLLKLGFGNYTLIRKTDNAKMGTCGLYDRDGFEGVDIGFAFLPEYEKQGYAYEAASKLKEVAFNELGIEVISGFTTKDNLASQKLLEKLDFQLEGTAKFSGEEEELLEYKLHKKK